MCVTLTYEYKIKNSIQNVNIVINFTKNFFLTIGNNCYSHVIFVVIFNDKKQNLKRLIYI